MLPFHGLLNSLFCWFASLSLPLSLWHRSQLCPTHLNTICCLICLLIWLWSSLVLSQFSKELDGTLIWVPLWCLVFSPLHLMVWRHRIGLIWFWAPVKIQVQDSWGAVFSGNSWSLTPTTGFIIRWRKKKNHQISSTAGRVSLPWPRKWHGSRPTKWRIASD